MDTHLFKVGVLKVFGDFVFDVDGGERLSFPKFDLPILVECDAFVCLFVSFRIAFAIFEAFWLCLRFVGTFGWKFGSFNLSFVAFVDVEVVADGIFVAELVFIIVGVFIAHFESTSRSFGDEYFTWATFLTGSLLFRFEALLSGFLMIPPLNASKDVADTEDADDADDVGAGSFVGIVVLFDSIGLLSLDKFVLSSVFCVFGN